jgi:biopolymer transport protein ExbD
MGAVLPLAGMIDIIFLLLVFFMTVSAFRDEERQIDVSLPATQTSQPARAGSQIIITIKDSGALFIGDREYTFETLRQTLSRLAQQFPNEPVVIRGDKDSSLGLAVRVMDAVYASGLKNVYIATIKPTSEL